MKNPAVLEQITECRTAIFDKTGTLTYGEPKLTEQLIAPGFAQKEVLTLAASLELYSKHPLARAILAAAKAEGLQLQQASHVSEPPGQGLRGTVSGHQIQITSRGKLLSQKVPGAEHLPPIAGGLECIIVIDGQFRGDLPIARCAASRRTFLYSASRTEASVPTHHDPFRRSRIGSALSRGASRHHRNSRGAKPGTKTGDREAGNRGAKTLYVGDGINDAPAMMAATVGMAVGQNSDVTAEAADVVAMENSLKKVDEFMHISRRMRSIALQSAVGGMVLESGRHDVRGRRISELR